MNIQSKTAVITGASSGIGKHFSRALVDKGATVYGLARRKQKLNEVADELGDAFIPVQLDITDHQAVDQWVDTTFGEQLQPDVLINNAGLGKFGNVEDLELDDWRQMIDTNLNGVYYMTRKIVPLMKENPNTCHIFNIASIAGLLGNPQISGYNATKFAVRGFSEALFKELRYDGIKVTCFYPGSIETEFFQTSGSGSNKNRMQPEEVAQILVNVLETSDNFLINEITMRPLNPKAG